jgi:hypothetical protein
MIGIFGIGRAFILGPRGYSKCSPSIVQFIQAIQDPGLSPTLEDEWSRMMEGTVCGQFDRVGSEQVNKVFLLVISVLKKCCALAFSTRPNKSEDADLTCRDPSCRICLSLASG